MSNNVSTENKKSDITLSMKVNTHRYCDFDADQNCIFFFGADDTEKSIQWVSAYPLVSKSKSKCNHQGDKTNNNNINNNNNNNNNNRKFPYINVFAKTGRFKTNEVKCKLVNVNVNVQISNTSKPASHIGLSPLALPPQHQIHYAQFPAYAHSSKLPQPQPPQLIPIHLQPTTVHAQAQAHHIMAHYEQKGQILAQQRAKVEAEIARRTQCIEELETKLNDDKHDGAIHYHKQRGLQRSISGPSYNMSHLQQPESVGARPVVRLPQEYMVSNGNVGNVQPAYSAIGGHSGDYQRHHYVNMPSTHSAVTVYVNGKTGSGSKRSASHLPYQYHL